MVRIVDFKPWAAPDAEHGFGGWTWYYDRVEYRTDRTGHGIWHWSKCRVNWIPDVGTREFYLPPDPSQALMALRRYYTLEQREIEERERRTTEGR